MFVPTAAPEPGPAPTPQEQPTELVDDGFVDAVVTRWDDAYQNGMAKAVIRTASLNNLMVAPEDLVTYGSLTVGVRIRCFVDKPDPGFKVPRARDISIYADVE